MLAGFFGMMSGVDGVPMRDVRVMTGRFVVAFFVMLGGFAVMGGGFLMMFGGFVVMLGTFVGHDEFPFFND
jgi:hypothetical protein